MNHADFEDLESFSKFLSGSANPWPRCDGAVEYKEDVIDIGGSKLIERLQQSVGKKLKRTDSLNRHFLPDVFFSDDIGLKLWRDINRLPEYYQTRDEIDLLNNHANEIVAQLDLPPEGSSIIDLGCGDTRKIRPLLDNINQKGLKLTYYALDLSLITVRESIAQLRPLYSFVNCVGLWGTFEDGLDFIQRIQGPRIFLSLGSIFGNDRFDRAVRFLQMWTGIMAENDRLLVGIDGNKNADTVWRSYHDSGGLFESFIRNGFVYSNKVIGGQWYRDEDWELSGLIEHEPLQHRFVLKATRDVIYEPASLVYKRGDTIECYEGFKNGPTVMRKQFLSAGLLEMGCWSSPSGNIYEYLVRLNGNRDQEERQEEC